MCVCVSLCALYCVYILKWNFPSLWLSHEWHILVDKRMIHQLRQVCSHPRLVHPCCVPPTQSLLCHYNYSFTDSRPCSHYRWQSEALDQAKPGVSFCVYLTRVHSMNNLWSDYNNYADLLIISNFCLFSVVPGFPDNFCSYSSGFSWVIELTTQNSMPNNMCQIIQTQIDY